MVSGVDILVSRNRTCEPGQVGNEAALSSHPVCREGAWIELTAMVTLSSAVTTQAAWIYKTIKAITSLSLVMAYFIPSFFLRTSYTPSSWT